MIRESIPWLYASAFRKDSERTAAAAKCHMLRICESRMLCKSSMLWKRLRDKELPGLLRGIPLAAIRARSDTPLHCAEGAGEWVA